MTLMLKADVANSIAIRHYVNSLYPAIQRIDDESAKLNYKYLNEMLAPFHTEVTRIQNEIRELNDQVASEGAYFVSKELIKRDSQLKEACLMAIRRIEQKQDSLTLFAEKFNDLLLAILELAKRDSSSFIKLSMSEKDKKVNELAHGTPAYDVISSVLRLPDLANGVLIIEVQEKLKLKARQKFEMYQAGKSASLIYAEIEQMIAEEILDKTSAEIRKVIVINEDGTKFLGATLPATNQKFFKRNQNKFEGYFAEMLAEMG